MAESMFLRTHSVGAADIYVGVSALDHMSKRPFSKALIPPRLFSTQIKSLCAGLSEFCRRGSIGIYNHRGEV